MALRSLFRNAVAVAVALLALGAHRAVIRGVALDGAALLAVAEYKADARLALGSGGTGFTEGQPAAVSLQFSKAFVFRFLFRPATTMIEMKGTAPYGEINI